MRTITKRELNQQTAKVLADVSAGETVVVTERGVVRWRIESTEHAADPIERLRTEGRIRGPEIDPAPWNDAAGPEDAERVERLHRWARGER